MNICQNTAVIGANYGDEGKGRVVDNIVKYANKPLVVRFSGSNNAAHTVYLDENTSNVFHLMGSGSLRGAPTYLSKHVSVDLVSLNNELTKFIEKYNFNSYIYIDPRCNVVLPYDVALNRAKEVLRGNSLHGSTGNGLNESIVRNEIYPIKVGTLEDSFNLFRLSHQRFSKEIEIYYTSLSGDLKDFVDFLLDSGNIASVYNKILSSLKHNCIEVTIPSLHEHSCIFEGSQGLLLDEYSPNYPHITRARTGAHNLIDIIREFNITIDEICYVSRVYLSRHGEDKNFICNKQIQRYFDIIDKTNIKNDWQGSMKYDFLNLDELSERVNIDYNMFKNHSPETTCKIALTCLDQCVNNEAPVIYEGEYIIMSNFKRDIVKSLHFKGYAVSTFESPVN